MSCALAYIYAVVRPARTCRGHERIAAHCSDIWRHSGGLGHGAQRSASQAIAQSRRGGGVLQGLGHVRA